MQRKLSKYLYSEYSHCPERFWLWMNDELVEPSERAELDPQIQFFKEQNEMLQRYAAQLLAQKENCEFETQKVFETDTYFAKANFLEINHSLDKQAIYEVRNAKTVKAHHFWDLAFIGYVAKQCGEKFSKFFLIHVNPDYIYNGDEIEPEKLLIIEDVTQKVKQRIVKIGKGIEEAIEFANGPMPSTDLETHSCRKKHCEFIRRHHPNLPKNSVYDLKGINKLTLQKLLKEGVLEMLDVPERYIQSNLQRAQMRLVRLDRPIIELERLKTWFDSLQYPLYFLDYEAITATVPVYEHSQPFQHIVFQYSLHVKAAAGAETIHYEFLAEGKQFPIPNLLKHLASQIEADNGSVLVWHDSFEKARNREMAEQCPEYQDFLLGINERIVDVEKVLRLMTVFLCIRILMVVLLLRKYCRSLCPMLQFMAIWVSLMVWRLLLVGSDI